MAFLCIVALLIAVGLLKSCLGADDPPRWRNQKQESLTIPQGAYISLQAEGIDDSSLDRAVLSTNETGSWRNETEEAFLWMQTAVSGFDNFGTATCKDGVLYAPSKADDTVYAINASTGSVIWSRPVRQCDISPCIDGDFVLVGECAYPDGTPIPSPKAIALNRTNGEEIWNFTEPDGYMWVGSPVVSGDFVYTTTLGPPYREGKIYALNKTTGNPIWNQSIGYTVCSVALDNGVVFVSTYNSTNPPGQFALNATNGEVIWRKNYGASWDSSPVVYNGMVIQVAYNTTAKVWSTLMLNETNGEVVHQFSGKGACSTPLVHDAKIFIPNRAAGDSRIYAYDLTSGAELWHTAQLHDGTFQDQSYSSPAAGGGAIYYQALNGTFYVLNETDGSILWSYALGGYGFGSPSVGDGCVFITNDYALYAFKIGPGSGEWPMFCQNNLHMSLSVQGVEYVKWPLTEPLHLQDVSNTWMTARLVWCNKTITSNAIAWKIYFFDSLGNTNATDVKVFYINMLIHNVAVTDIVPKDILIEQNQTTSINVTVANQGSYTESFNVTLHYDSTEIGFQPLTLNANGWQLLTFEWNTTGVHIANYTLAANATEIVGEADPADNIYILQYQIEVVPEFSTLLIFIAMFIASSLAATALTRKTATRACD